MVGTEISVEVIGGNGATTVAAIPVSITVPDIPDTSVLVTVEVTFLTFVVTNIFEADSSDVSVGRTFVKVSVTITFVPGTRVFVIAASAVVLIGTTSVWVIVLILVVPGRVENDVTGTRLVELTVVITVVLAGTKLVVVILIS